LVALFALLFTAAIPCAAAHIEVNTGKCDKDMSVNAPGCSDKGLWHFNLKTGNVLRVKKFSGDKWR
jgi:hypothetical protein